MHLMMQHLTLPPIEEAPSWPPGDTQISLRLLAGQPDSRTVLQM